MRSVIAAAVVTPALAVPAAAAAQTVIGSGSSAEQPILTALFAGYKKVQPKVKFIYNADGGNAGIKDVQTRHSVFAVNTRAPLPSDSGTTQFKLYLDGLCLDVNRANSLNNISIQNAANIFLGTSTSWTQVSGSSLTGTIDPIGRNSTAGSYTFFQKAVLNGATQATSVQQQASDGLVASAIKNDNNAIGYVGLAHSGASNGIKTLRLNGIACSPKNIKSEKYAMSRFIWGVLSTNHQNRAAAKFFDWVRTSKRAGKIIAQAGAVPAFNKK